MAIHRCIRCGSLNRVPEGRGGAGPVCGRCKSRLDTTGAPQPVDGNDLQEVVANAPVPVLVDFWATWCGPCRMASPIVDDLARRNAGRLLVLKFDTDADPAGASRHRIQGVPTFILFQGGREIARQSGVMPRERLQAWIDGATRGPTAKAS